MRWSSNSSLLCLPVCLVIVWTVDSVVHNDGGVLLQRNIAGLWWHERDTWIRMKRQILAAYRLLSQVFLWNQVDTHCLGISVRCLLLRNSWGFLSSALMYYSYALNGCVLAASYCANKVFVLLVVWALWTLDFSKIIVS